MSTTASTPTTYHDVALPSGTTMHYASAGSRAHPTVLLLHGFPSSSAQFRALIPRLAGEYHVLAPDLPGFGNTAVRAGTRPTFALLAAAVGELLDALKVARFAVYIFDYGAPAGLRLALARPAAVAGIVSQNGNAYEVGLGPFWAPLQQWWASGVDGLTDAASRDAFRAFVADIETTKAQYVDGTPAALRARLDPKAWALDHAQNLAPADRREAQVDLFWDYRTNLGFYPKFHAYFHDSRVPVLAVWGKNDTIFVPAGAEAFRRDADVQVELLDGGHFLLETHVDEVARLMLPFLRMLKWE